MISNANYEMKRMICLFIFLALLAGCQDKSDNKLPQQEDSPVVAEVGDKLIHEMDIDYEILSMPESMRHIMQDDLARAKVLEVMIKREAVAQRARDMGLNLDPLIAYRMHQAENTVLIESVRDWQGHDRDKPTDAKIEAYYKQHLDDFMIPEQVHARHILVPDKQEALDILKQLKVEPESFPTLAAQYSIDDSNKGRGGDLNWFSRGAMVKPFEDAVFALNEKNRFSKPVKTDFGWHVIEWLGKRDKSMPSLEEVHDEISAIIEKEQLNAWVKSLIEQADIDIVKPEYRLRQSE